MDTKALLLKRDRLTLSLDDRRRAVLFQDRQVRHSFLGLGERMPFWMRMAAGTVLPKMTAGIWGKALLSVAPVALGFIRNRSGSSFFKRALLAGASHLVSKFRH
jgi:hypothetical protein